MQETEWEVLPELYRLFREKHPELLLNESTWALTNVLRSNREKRVAADAIRKTGRHWIGHRERFHTVLFDLLTGAA
jgi:hypothetical protein